MSWTIDDLQELSKASNHRVRYDGTGFIWEHNISGEWELHSIFTYKSYNYYMHLIHFWCAKWGQELQSRRRSENRRVLKELKHKKRIQNKIIKIQSYNNLDLSDKVKLLTELLPDEPQSYIADILGVSRQTINKYSR